jgi:hypothetical protein
MKHPRGKKGVFSDAGLVATEGSPMKHYGLALNVACWVANLWRETCSAARSPQNLRCR